MWFTEDAISPMILFGVVAIGLYVAWTSTRQRKYLTWAVIAVAAAVVVFVAEQAIVTDPEKVESTLLELIDTFIEESRTVTGSSAPAVVRCHSFFAADNASDRGRVTAALLLVEVQADLRITDVQVRLTNNSTRAITHFRANGTVSVSGAPYHRPTRWELTWRKDGGEWKVTNTKMLNVMNGDEIPIPRVDR